MPRVLTLLLILFTLTSPAQAATSYTTVTQPPPISIEVNMPFTVVQQVTGPARLLFGIGGCGCFSIIAVSISPTELAPAPLQPGGDAFWTSVEVPEGITATYTVVLEAREFGAQVLSLNDAIYTVRVTRPAAPPSPPTPTPPSVRSVWLPFASRAQAPSSTFHTALPLLFKPRS